MSDKLDLLQLDATNDLQLQEVMALGDVVINALFYTFNEKVARIAVEIGVHSIDLGGHIGGATDAVLGLAEKAEAKGVTIIPDLRGGAWNDQHLSRLWSGQARQSG